MSIKWGEEYWSLRPCSMSLVSLCQLWCLRPCRSWPRSGLHVLKPPSWLVPSESYQAALPTGPTFPWPQDAWRGLKRRSEKDTQWAVAAPWAHCLEGGGCLCLTPFAPCATQGVEAPGSQHQPQRRRPLPPPPPPATAPCPGAFTQCTQCTAVPSGPEQCHPLHLHPGSSSPAWCAGFWPIHYIYVLKPLVLLYVTVP